MSLVNDMLRDLEQRGQESRGPLTDQAVKTVAPDTVEKSAVSKPFLVIVVLLSAAILAYGWLYWQDLQPAQATASTPVSQPVPAVIEPAASVVDVAQPAVEVTPPAPKVIISPISLAPLRVERVSWRDLPTGGELLLRFSGRPDAELLSQTQDALEVGFPGAELDQTLPLPSRDVISRFNFRSADQQLMLDLRAVREARFELTHVDARSLKISVVLSRLPEPEVAAATPVQLPTTAATSAGAVAPAASKIQPTQATQAVVAVDKPSSQPEVKQPKLLDDEKIVARARKLLQKNRVRQAEKLLEETLKQAPDYLGSRALLASLYLAGGQSGKAAVLVEEGMAQAPLDSGLKKVKARLMLASGEASEAITLLRRSPPAIALDAEYHEILAAALQQTGQADEAINVYYQLLQHRSREARLWVGLGYSLELARRNDDARKAYESSMQIPNLDENLKSFVTQRLDQLAER